VIGNQLLSLITAAKLARLEPALEEVDLARDQVLFQVGEPLGEVYFPHSGVISLQILDSDGGMVEAATIGDEGVVGLGGLLSGDISHTKQVVQLPGRAARLSREALLHALSQSPSLRDLMTSHADAFTAHVLQIAACNAQHSTEERLARWLLRAFDRCATDRIRLTHDDLALAFGVRRPTVTLIIRSLQAANIIDATRGAIALVDRGALERISCECYAAITKNYERSLARFRR
jgi:CRP-like cAMP-binding protein